MRLASLVSPGEQKEIAVRITYDEGSCAPRFGAERLSKLDARLLVFEKERLCIFQRDRSGEQLFGIAVGAIEDWLIDLAKVQPDVVAEHLAVKRRLTVGERDREAEHP